MTKLFKKKKKKFNPEKLEAYESDESTNDYPGVNYADYEFYMH